MTTHSTTAPSQTTSTAPATETAPLPSTFKQLSRTPLIPERILKRHGAYCAIDTRFRAAARFLQCVWLRDHDIPTAASQPHASTDGALAFGSILSAEAANAGRNFLTPAIHRLALQEWLLCEDDAAIDDERLFGNALSSMPLVFNLFAPMALDLKLATSVFRSLLPRFVQSVHRFAFEHSCGRGKDEFLADRTAWDLAVHVTTTSGEPGIIYCELKYSESLDGNPARLRPRYAEVSREVQLYDNPDSLILRATPIEQLWREHMLAAKAVLQGVTPRAVFLAIAPQLNRRVWGAFRVYQGELVQPDQHDTSRVPFVPLTLERVIETIAEAGAGDFANALWQRYCNFERVYRVALQEIAGDVAASSTPARRAPSRTTPKAALPPARQAIPVRNRTARVANATLPGTVNSTKQAAR